jgi:hypothetical protein
MIARYSKSYPYLAIAQHYDIPYAEVLAASDLYDRFRLSPPYAEWRYMVWALERDKVQRNIK